VKQLRQRPAGDVLHYNKVITTLGLEPVDLDNVRLAQLGRRARFLKESNSFLA